MVWPVSTSTTEPNTPVIVKAGPEPAMTAITGEAYIRPAQLIEPTRIHLLISQGIYDILSKTPELGEVRSEWLTTNNTRVDIVRQKDNELIFYEIKSYPSIRTCIREAVGQLLEYAYWPGQQSAIELIIVIPLPASMETRTYMNTLRVTLNIPIWYQQFDLVLNRLSDKV